jgi:hypothetical protein
LLHQSHCLDTKKQNNSKVNLFLHRRKKVAIPTLIVSTQGLIRAKLRQINRLEESLKRSSYPTPLLQREMARRKAECLVALIKEALNSKVAWEDILSIIEQNFSDPASTELVYEALKEANLHEDLEKVALSLL